MIVSETNSPAPVQPPVRALKAAMAAIGLMLFAVAAGAAGEAGRQLGWPPFEREALAVPGGGTLYGSAKVGLPGV